LVAVFVAAALVVTPACGTATISYRGGSKVEGTIVGSSRNFIEVKQESGGRVKSIARDDIADIDHPGNVLALAGSLLLAFGVVTLAAWGLGDCENRALGGCAGLYTPPAVGAGLVIWGTVVWMRSSMAADGSTTGPSRPVEARLWPGRSLHLLPLVARQDGDRRLLGGALALSF
jgi:hypothetical protein